MCLKNVCCRSCTNIFTILLFHISQIAPLVAIRMRNCSHSVMSYGNQVIGAPTEVDKYSSAWFWASVSEL